MNTRFGGEGLQLASEHSVDVIIVDYCMPEMNGQEVAIEMRRLKRGVTIIMLSGAVDVPEEALSKVDAFVAKDRLASQLTVPEGFAQNTLVIPSPKQKTLYIRLRDDPTTVNTAVFPLLPSAQ